MKFEKLQPGATVYDVGRHKMGNTTVSTVAVWQVRVLKVDSEKRRVLASWNCNAPRTYYERDVSRWREREPVLIRGGFGSARLATREEQKAARQRPLVTPNVGVEAPTTAPRKDEDATDCPAVVGRLERPVRRSV